MSRRRRTAVRGAPLTIREQTGYELSSYDKESKKGRLIVCANCGLPGGTLVKCNDDYVHKDASTCRILQLRKRRSAKVKIKETQKT